MRAEGEDASDNGRHGFSRSRTRVCDFFSSRALISDDSEDSSLQRCFHLPLDLESEKLGDWFIMAKHFVKQFFSSIWLDGCTRLFGAITCLFFFDKSDFSNLCLVGFKYSRQATSAQQTEGVADDLEFNLYQRPEVQGDICSNQSQISYSLKYDIL